MPNAINSTVLRFSISIVVFCFAVDRVLKWLALNQLPRDGIFLVPETVGAVLERNQGIAYGIRLPTILLLPLVCLFLAILTALFLRAHRRGEIVIALGIALIAVGAFSNLLDRLRYGYVVDMLVLTRWPVFNIADLMIAAGAVAVIFSVFRKHQ